ncbi:MAG: ATP-binding protein [Roseateles asaccharophilus]|uniref:histidine kinase n=1 Tax=Roseateles asaccharophilus TaxID=582607 RepID=A0A4R6NAU1_9BURK|nr:ATP-binding protein [Roseateles asaccharophilus]MDN3546666.1 ATP-binding protein [Roseateles asaccharophilus]TDP12889.1 PAS domain S-box-containing protein [Roseateles asaccharophilus]
MRSLSLRSWWTLLLLLLVSTMFAVVGSLVLAYRLPQVEQRNRDLLNERVQGARHQLEQYTRMVEDQLRGFATAASQMDGPRRQMLAQVLADHSRLFNAVYVLDHEQRVEVLALAADQGPPLLDQLRGMDLSASPLVRELARGAQGHSNAPLWSGEYLSVLSGRNTVAVGLLLQGRSFILELSAPQLLASISRRGQASSAEFELIVIDQRGRELASSHGVEGRMLFRDFSGSASFRAALAGQDPPPQEVGTDGQALSYAGTRSDKLGWVLMASSPRGMAEYHYRVTVLLVLAGLIAGPVLALIAAPVAAAFMARPLTRLQRRVRAIAAGELNPPSVKPSAILELQRLSEDIARMVDQLQAREADARRAAERLSATLESAPSIAIQWFDSEGRILYWNEASTRMYGFSALEAVGYSLAERTLYLRDEEQVQALKAVIADVIETGQPFGPTEFTLRHKDGHELLVLATLFAIPAEDGSRLVVCMDVDVTEHRRAEDQIRKLNLELEDRVVERTEALSAANAELAMNLEALRQAQQQLVQAEKLSALGRLVAGVAHELNTPIGNSLMAVSSLREPMEQIRAAMAGGGLKRSMLESFVTHVGEGTDIAQRNLSRAAELVMSFKQVAVDQTTTQRRRFKLDAAIEEILLTLNPMLKRSAHKLSLDIETDIELDSYPGPLAQVITNLVHNALLHAFEGREGGGQISIRARRLEAQPGLVQLDVGDNGLGIPAQAMGRIFDPFYTTRMGRGGTGLGLHIVHNLVTQLMGGQIRVQSQEGKGTVFELLLPLEAPASSAPA